VNQRPSATLANHLSWKNHTMTDKEIDNLLTYIEENIEKFE
jgi:hypothetical protein